MTLLFFQSLQKDFETVCQRLKDCNLSDKVIDFVTCLFDSPVLQKYLGVPERANDTQVIS